MPETFQLAAQLLEIIGFAVVHDCRGAQRHRLRARARQVNNAQTAMTQRHAFADKYSLAVRTAVSDGLRHSADSEVKIVGGLEAVYPADAAHETIRLFVLTSNASTKREVDLKKPQIIHAAVLPCAASLGCP